MLPFRMFVATHPRRSTFSLAPRHLGASGLPQKTCDGAARDPYLFTPLLRYLLSPHSFPCHTSKNSPVSPSAATLTKSRGWRDAAVNQESQDRRFRPGRKGSVLLLVGWSGVSLLRQRQEPPPLRRAKAQQRIARCDGFRSSKAHAKAKRLRLGIHSRSREDLHRFRQWHLPLKSDQPRSNLRASGYFFVCFRLLGSGDTCLLDVIAVSMGVLAFAARSFFTDSGILSAFFTRTLTCQICFSVNRSLNAGIPDIRIPFSPFQTDSHASSSSTPRP